MTDKVDAFKNILKGILAESYNSNDIKAIVEKIQEENETIPLICFNKKTGAVHDISEDAKDRKKLVMRNSVQNLINWINGVTRPTMLFKTREQAIDFLLYFCGQSYQNFPYPARRKTFNTHLKVFGFDNLRLLGSWQEFAVVCALKFAPKTEPVYKWFREIYMNEKLKQCTSADYISDENYEESGQEVEEKFTNQIMKVFDKLNRIGTADERKNEETVWWFLSEYGREIGRSRLSALRLYETLVLGENKLGKDLFDGNAQDANSEQLKDRLGEELETGRTLAQEFRERCTTSDFFEEYKACREKAYRVELEDARKKDATATIFDLSPDDNSEKGSPKNESPNSMLNTFLRLKSKSHVSPEEYCAIQHQLGEKLGESDAASEWKNLPPSELVKKSNEYKAAWHEEAEAFYLLKTKKGTGANELREKIIPDYESRVFYDFRGLGISVSREILVWAFILCLKSSTIKNTVALDGRLMVNLVANKLKNEIDGLLNACGMLSLNKEYSSGDRELLNALKGVDYEKIYSDQSESYPFREFVLQKEKESKLTL